MLSAVMPGQAANPREVTVMSENLYVGADLAPAMGAVMTGDPEAIIAGVTAFWQQVQATNFPERAAAIADQIEAQVATGAGDHGEQVVYH